MNNLNKINVLYISHDAHLNGAPKSLLEYVTKIQYKGVNPIVVIPSKGDLKKKLEKEGIQVKVIPYMQCVYKDNFGINKYVEYVSTNSRAIKEIRGIIKENKIQIVHTNSLAVNVGAVAAIYEHIPHVWHFREYIEEDFNYKLINPFWIRYLVKKSNCCIAISKSIKQKYKQKYGVNIVQLYNGLENEIYYYPVEKINNLGDNAKLLIAGSISEGKGQWDAIRAVEILINKGITKFHLDIIGNGDVIYINQLKSYVKNRNLLSYISFYKYSDDLQKMRIKSTIYLMCSRMEAFGRVTAEAMMAGKIVIGKNSGGTKELIGEHEERGYLYEPGHPEELANKILYAIENKDETIEKEKEAQKYIMRITDLDVYTDRILQIYKKILNRKI